jgi:hypothetical protein
MLNEKEQEEITMATLTKKDLLKDIEDNSNYKRVKSLIVTNT